MSEKITKKKLEEALDTYANLVEMYPDNEAYLKRYAEMLSAMGRKSTETAILQHLYDLILARSADEAHAFAAKHPQIGRISQNDIMFDGKDKHIIAGEIMMELLGNIWLRLHQKKLNEGQAVCRFGEESNSIIIVLKGKVDTFAIKENNTRLLIETIEAHDILGEATFFKPGKFSMDAFVASETATIVKVPRKKLQEMVETNDYLKDMLSQRSLFRTNIHAIARCQPFYALPQRLNYYLARSLTLRKYKTGTMIYALQQPMDGAGIILSGQACPLAKNSEGKRLLLPPFEVGTMIGDLALTGEKAVSDSNIMAKTDVSIAHFPYQSLLNASVAYLPLKEKLTNHLASQQAHIMASLSRINHD